MRERTEEEENIRRFERERGSKQSRQEVREQKEQRKLRPDGRSRGGKRHRERFNFWGEHKTCFGPHLTGGWLNENDAFAASEPNTGSVGRQTGAQAQQTEGRTAFSP